MQAETCHRYKMKNKGSKMEKLIKSRLDNWDIAKGIYEVIADMKLLNDYPNIDLKKLLFSLSHADIEKLAQVVTGKIKKYTVSQAMEAVAYFLSVIFNKIATEPGYCDMLKLITVLPMIQPPNPESSNSASSTPS